MQYNYPWMPIDPIEAFVFDCDGTLVSIEGVEELAEMNGVLEPIHVMTQRAMAETGVDVNMYAKRLEIINPTHNQVDSLGKKYIESMAEDVRDIISLLQRLGKAVYIISAGLYPAVAVLAEELAIAKENVFAVKIFFDEKGEYKYFDTDTPLVHRTGKAVLIEDIKETYQTVLHIGDGLNDFAAHAYSTRFIGFGGIYYRENIKQMCKYYISNPSMAAMLPLALTGEEVAMLAGSDMPLYKKGLGHIHNDEVKIAIPL